MPTQTHRSSPGRRQGSHSRPSQRQPEDHGQNRRSQGRASESQNQPAYGRSPDRERGESRRFNSENPGRSSEQGRGDYRSGDRQGRQSAGNRGDSQNRERNAEGRFLREGDRRYAGERSFNEGNREGNGYDRLENDGAHSQNRRHEPFRASRGSDHSTSRRSDERSDQSRSQNEGNHDRGRPNTWSENEDTDQDPGGWTEGRGQDRSNREQDYGDGDYQENQGNSSSFYSDDERQGRRRVENDPYEAEQNDYSRSRRSRDWESADTGW